MSRERSRERDYRDRERSPERDRRRERTERNAGRVSVLCRNLPLDVRPEDVREKFSKYGEIRDIYLPRDYYNNRPKGFGFIEFVDLQDAEDAIYALDRSLFNGREINVLLSKESRKTPREMAVRDERAGRAPTRGYEPRDRYGGDRRDDRRRGRSYSRSRSPRRRDSRSRSRGHGRRSRSRSPVRRRYSRSRSRGRRSRSRSRSPARSPSRSRSPAVRSKSRSPARSKSRSPVRSKSRSPVRSKSRSPVRSKSRSPAGRSRSRSPAREAEEPEGRAPEADAEEGGAADE
eukprot:scaffold2.g6971.t1